MYERALKTVEKYGMIKSGDGITVGVSGGADSVVLLDFLCRLRDDMELKIAVCHINHGFRGAESDRDEEFVRKLCEKYGVEFHLLRADVGALAKERGISGEECGREVRYGFFREVACGGKIATAHTLSDSMETVILNMARGAGLKGLCGIPAVRGEIIRPLIECTRAQIEEYAAERGLEFVTDSTNLTDDYTRNKIRHNIIPELYKINESFDRAFFRVSEAVSEDSEYLEKKSAELKSEAKRENGYDAGVLLKAPNALKNRVIAAVFSENGVEKNEKRIRAVGNALGKESYKEQVAKDKYAVISGGIFKIETQKNEHFEEFQIPFAEGKYKINEKYEIKCAIIGKEEYKSSKKINSKLLKNSFDCGKINGNLVVRNRRAGDSIKLCGRRCTKSLKKLFNEGAVAVEARERIPCIADDDGIVWVCGFGCDERVRVDEKSDKVCVIEVLGGE